MVRGFNCATLVVVFFILHLGSQVLAQDLSQQIVQNRANAISQIEKPYVIYISADGFRHDYADKFDAKNLIALRKRGVHAASMKPAFPSVTFSNHYTLATGMYPAHHGIVNNSFYDPYKKQIYARADPTSVSDSTWYKGVPIWVLAEQQKMLTAVFYWVGSETPIMGVRPTYWYNFNMVIPMDERLKAVKEWLELPADKRPHLINFYFPEVDVAGHFFGAESEQIAAAVKFVDNGVGEMVKLVTATGLPVNFVFVSDHGMADVDHIKTLPLPAIIDREKFMVPNGDVILQLYAKNCRDIKPLYRKLKKERGEYDVYLTTDMPKRWHFNATDNKQGRIGDIILIPHYPKIFNLAGKATTKGKHGFDNDMPEMQAIFYAWGPAFKDGVKIKSFENIHVYPLLAKILGLSYAHKIDGDLQVLEPILK